MRTEMFEIIAETAIRDVVLYDGACGFCSRWMELWTCVLGRYGIGVAPLQTPGVAETLRINPDELLADLLVLDAGGNVHRGVDAYLFVWRRIGWLRPLSWIFAPRLMRQLLRAGYELFKANRYRISSRCGFRPHLPTAHVCESPEQNSETCRLQGQGI